MGLLLLAFEKQAAKKKAEPQVQAAAPPPTIGPPFHPEWAPPVGWQSEENPGGWKRPQELKRRHELYLWDQWKKGGETPELTAPLIQSLRPIIYKQGVQMWADRVPIPKPVIEAKATQLAITSLRKYNPVKAQINTHLGNQLQSMHRFITTRQNMTRVTEERRRLIGPYQRAMGRLKERLEREPTVLELADEMKVPVASVEKLLLELKDDLMASASTTEDPFLDETPESQLKLQLIRYSLTPDEEKVFDYLMGSGGKPLITSTGAIAKREGWADSKVSQLKNSIMRKWKGGK